MALKNTLGYAPDVAEAHRLELAEAVFRFQAVVIIALTCFAAVVRPTYDTWWYDLSHSGRFTLLLAGAVLALVSAEIVAYSHRNARQVISLFALISVACSSGASTVFVVDLTHLSDVVFGLFTLGVSAYAAALWHRYGGGLLHIATFGLVVMSAVTITYGICDQPVDVAPVASTVLPGRPGAPAVASALIAGWVFVSCWIAACGLGLTPNPAAGIFAAMSCAGVMTASLLLVAPQITWLPEFLLMTSLLIGWLAKRAPGARLALVGAMCVSLAAWALIGTGLLFFVSQGVAV